MYSVKKIILLVLANLFLINCSTVKYVPTETKTVYNYVDSVRIRDSIVIIPIERYVDIVPQYDTLKLATSLAESISYVDTTLHLLRGSIENKKGITEHTVYKEKIVTQIDSVYVEKPVEVVVEKTKAPSILWYSLGLNLLFIIGIAIKIYLKFK